MLTRGICPNIQMFLFDANFHEAVWEQQKIFYVNHAAIVFKVNVKKSQT